MAAFEYCALNAKGRKISGIIDAETSAAAAAKLRSQDIFPVSVNKIDSQPALTGGKYGFFLKPGASELAMITRQMSTLLSAGFPLVNVIETLISLTGSGGMKKILSGVRDAVEEGYSFSKALALYPGVFSELFINMVNAGESSGTLEIVLERLADFMEAREDSKRKIRAALAYPVLMAFIGLAVLSVLLTYVVPGIVSIFSDMGQTLPLPTIVLIRVSSLLREWWWAVLAVSIIIFIIGVMARKTEKGRFMTDAFMLRMPLYGLLLKKMTAARFTRTFGSLLSSGVPVLAALNISETIAGNMVFRRFISRACERVEQGDSIGDALADGNVFPELASRMIKTGEASGELEKMLEKAAVFFEKDVQAVVTTATSLLEPVIILVMGLIVGGIIMSICMPIFQINQFIG